MRKLVINRYWFEKRGEKKKKEAKRLENNKLLEVVFTKGKADITEDLERIYQEASNRTETNELRLLIVLDETRLLKA